MGRPDVFEEAVRLSMTQRPSSISGKVRTRREGPLITVPAFAEPEVGVCHFFGTRRQGYDSEKQMPAPEMPAQWGEFGALNGVPSRNGLCKPGPVTVVSVRQVHGTDILVLDRAGDGNETFSGEWDAIVTNRPHLLLTVRTADCVPLLLYDPVQRVVAAVHAGWRGAVAGIVPKTLLLMRRRFGSDLGLVRLGIGPSVGPCCYEVDAPVLERLRADFANWHLVVRETGTDVAMLDLRELVRRQAEEVGVSSEWITTLRLCTMCHPDLFYSYRREGAVVGTMVSGIMLMPRANVR